MVACRRSASSMSVCVVVILGGKSAGWQSRRYAQESSHGRTRECLSDKLFALRTRLNRRHRPHTVNTWNSARKIRRPARRRPA